MEPSSRRDKSGTTAWVSIDELVPPQPGQSASSAKTPPPLPDLGLVAGRRLNGDEAYYRVNLGPTRRILLGKVFRFPNQ